MKRVSRVCNSDAQSTQRQEKAWQLIAGTCQTSCQSHSWLKRILPKGFSKKKKKKRQNYFKWSPTKSVFFHFVRFLPVWLWWGRRLDLLLSDQSDSCRVCFGFCSALVLLTPTSRQVFTFCSCFSLLPCFLSSSSSSSFFILALWAHVCACECVYVCACVRACISVTASLYPAHFFVRMGPLSEHLCVSYTMH